MLLQIALILHMDSALIRLDKAVFKYDNPLLGTNAIAYCIDTVELHLLLLLQIEGATATDWMCCCMTMVLWNATVDLVGLLLRIK